MLHAFAIYPGAVGAANDGLYYRFHSLSKTSHITILLTSSTPVT